jgi:RNA polymerase sigma factor (sigma-70 family)
LPHASDADDARHLAAGDIAWLLARYEPVVRARCVARLRGHPAAEDVAQDVMLRLLAEFHRGRRYEGLPYRVVVHQVTTWTIDDHFAGRPTDARLPEGWEPAAPDSADEVVERHSLGALLAPLPDGSRRVLELRYLDGMEIDEIADRLGMTRNAVDQALHRGHRALREALTVDA